MKYDLDLVLDEKNSLSLMLKQIEPNSVILEFGPANGRMTRYLKEKLQCTVYIVEIDEEAAKDAVRYAKDAVVDDIENFKWLDKWANISFDYILFADVLEHLRNPQEVLSKTKGILKEQGKVIFSVPNVAHNSIMINLYNNIFNYTPLGLLDNTHIHLFAYNTLKEFCHFAGYFPIIEDAIYSQVGENEISNSFNDVDKSVANVLKDRKYGNVYQYVFTLQKEEYVKFNSHTTDFRIKANMPTNTFKVYLDRGAGWTEDNCITYSVHTPTEICKVIELESCEEISAIRIDPLDASGVYKIKKIQLADELGERQWKLSECESNAAILSEDYLLCGNDDPQITIAPVCLEKKATLTVEIQCLCRNGEEKAIQTCMDIINQSEEQRKKAQFELAEHIKRIEIYGAKLTEKENEVSLLSEELERRAVELEHRMDEINIRDRKIDEQQNEIKLLNEELERRAVELNNRMNLINEQSAELRKIQELEERIKEYEEEKCRKRGFISRLLDK